MSHRYFCKAVSHIVSLITQPHSFDPCWPCKHIECDQTIILVDDLVSAEGSLWG